MPVVSIRFSQEPLHQRLKNSARHHNMGISTLAERLIDEGLRMEAHPLVMFRDGPSGRRAVLLHGTEVVDVVGSIVGGDVPVSERRARASELLGVAPGVVDAAMAYYADHTHEIDAQLAARAQLADSTEASWRRQQALLQK